MTDKPLLQENERVLRKSGRGNNGDNKPKPQVVQESERVRCDACNHFIGHGGVYFEAMTARRVGGAPPPMYAAKRTMCESCEAPDGWRLRAERAENALRDIAVIGVGTTSARDDALEMQRIARRVIRPDDDD